MIDVIPRISRSLNYRVALVIPSGRNERGIARKQVITANAQVTIDPTNEPQNEPTVSIDPVDNSRVAAGANDYRLDAKANDAWLGFYTSKDNGTKWIDSLLTG